MKNKTKMTSEEYKDIKVAMYNLHITAVLSNDADERASAQEELTKLDKELAQLPKDQLEELENQFIKDVDKSIADMINTIKTKEVTFKEFKHIILDEFNKFEQFWEENKRKDNTYFPDKMAEGDWFEQFLMFVGQ